MCDKPAVVNIPFQLAHRISFLHGVLYLYLAPAPDFLDGPNNLVTAHRKRCNRIVELDPKGAFDLFIDIGVEELPAFLPAEV